MRNSLFDMKEMGQYLMVRAEIETAIHLENAVKMIKRFTNSNVSLKKIHINLDRKNPSFF